MFIIKKTIAIGAMCIIIGVSFLGCKIKTNQVNAEKDTIIVKENTTSAKQTNVDLSKFKIADKEDSYSSTMSGLNTKKGYAKFFFHKFSGTRTVAEIKKNCRISYKSHIEKGKLDVVILDSAGNTLKVLEANKEENIELNFSDKNEYIIKAVGDEAYKGDIIIETK
ncbi:MAG: hypothetical protein ACREV6_16415 [Clostridium sp.]|uniref:hypothetical protein n=1 Tax=Clostridium sp. TaxID=1506 RepID=UPI003D6D4FD4